jgi:hypothetical protein
MVWGAIGLGLKSKLTFVDGSLNGERYREMFMDNGICESIKTRFGDHTGYYQQEGGLAHYARAPCSFFAIKAWRSSQTDRRIHQIYPSSTISGEY